MIADDEPEVHFISRLVLKDFTFEDRPLEFISAYSAAETCELLQKHHDTAVLLLDVVMESDNSGLDAVRFIREELKNHFVRIILRTGQPGQAPERRVVIDYDINDYKEKTELTAQKLVTTILSALRAYRDIQTIDASRKGLEQIVLASATLFECHSMRQFASGILTQLTSLLRLQRDSLLMQASGFTATRHLEDFVIVAGTGRYEAASGLSLNEIAPPEVMARLEAASKQRASLIGEHDFAGYFRTSTGVENIVYMQSQNPLSDLDIRLLRVFSTNVAVAFDNLHLNREIANTQMELIHTLGEVVETRSHETGNHVFRVGECAQLLALKLGMSQADAEIIRIASPMHDLGKIGISDQVLGKPGTYLPAEFESMKSHTLIGHNILKASNRRILQAAAIIALQHHERWDGQGYPQGLAGEQIDILGRIVSLADVFDALGHKRVYKPAWSREDVKEYIKTQRGTQFDPHMVDVFIEHYDEFVAILDSYPDEMHVESVED